MLVVIPVGSMLSSAPPWALCGVTTPKLGVGSCLSLVYLSRIAGSESALPAGPSARGTVDARKEFNHVITKLVCVVDETREEFLLGDFCPVRNRISACSSSRRDLAASSTFTAVSILTTETSYTLLPYSL